MLTLVVVVPKQVHRNQKIWEWQKEILPYGTDHHKRNGQERWWSIAFVAATVCLWPVPMLTERNGGRERKFNSLILKA